MARISTAMCALALLFFLAAGSVQASDVMIKKPLKHSNWVPTVVSRDKVLNSRTHLMQSPGTVLDSTYYDWQRNGGLDDHIATFDDNGTGKVNATMMATYLEDASDRAMRYYHYNGTSWSGHGMEVFPAKNGYGSMSQFSDGAVAICAHTDLDAQGLRAYSTFDAFLGLYAFTAFGSDPAAALIWPRVSVNSDQSITMTGTDQGSYDVSACKAADKFSGFGSWTSMRTLAPDWMDDDMEWPTVHSGTNGNVGIVIPDNAGSVRLFSSTDNGGTWAVQTIAALDTAGAPTGLDSTAARVGWINSDIMYIGDEPHVAWSAGQVLNDGAGGYGITDFKATIFHWSPSTGIDTVVVASVQSADDTRADYVPTPFNHLSVDWPTMGVAVDGNTIVMGFTSFSTDDIDTTSTLGFGDIWVTASGDNGNTWVDAVNFTNSNGTNLGWDDRYPSIARTNVDNDAAPGLDAYMIYLSDDLAGTNVQGTESAVNMDYVMFAGIDLDDVGVGDSHHGGQSLPRTTALRQNYPNPFNPSTTINYRVPARSHVSVKIYDVRGRLIQTLVDNNKEVGSYSVQWNGKDSGGSQVSSGIYLYTMETDNNFRSTKKMVVLK